MKAITENGSAITIDDQYEIKRGGEGKILTIPELPGNVAKIYLNPNYKHMSKAQKDALSVLDGRYFVKPLELIFDRKDPNNILGFTMEYLKDDFLPLAALFNKNFCAGNGVDESFKIEISRRLILGVESAHQQDIVMGDLSGLNVLVNLNREIRFLDVDSYETPVHTHWGLLFDEIRDYLYQGKVSKNSDHFALAVLIFNLFTYLHPFKGVHKAVKSIAERMIRKIPVFLHSPDLIIPKCYQPISDVFLQQQFEEIFLQGKRFLLRLQSQVTVVTKTATVAPVAVIKSSLKIREIYKPEKNEFIRDAKFSNGLGMLLTNQKILLLDLSNHGYVVTKQSFTYAQVFSSGKKGKTELFVGDNNLAAVEGQELKIYRESSGWLTMANTRFSEEARFKQVANILVVLDGEFMRLIHLDQVIQDQVLIEQTAVFTPGFDVFNGLIQNVGGVQYIFYSSGKTLSTVKSPVQLRSVKVSGNTGIAAYEETLSGENSLRYEYFAIQGLTMQMSGERIQVMKTIGFKAMNAKEGVIFEAADDLLLLRKTGDFKVVQEMDCNLLSDESNLAVCQAGIVAFEKDFCYLLNSN